MRTLALANECRGAGVDFRLFFSFDGDFDWFGEEVTALIPRPFPDYFCDNIGEVRRAWGWGWGGRGGVCGVASAAAAAVTAAAWCWDWGAHGAVTAGPGAGARTVP